LKIIMMPVKYRKAARGPLSGFVVVWLFASTLTGCGRQTSEAAAGSSPAEPASVSQPHYARLFGKRYRTKVDLYLFALTSDPDYKYLGRGDGGSKFLSARLPATVSRGNAGRTYGLIKILDVVPRGSELTIRAETHEVTPFSGIQGTAGIPMGFICALTYNGKQMDDVLSEFIQSHKEATGAVPNQEIDANMAAPLEE